MSKAQRIVAGIFAAFLLLVAFGCYDSGEVLPGLAALLASMGLTLWAMRPNERGV